MLEATPSGRGSGAALDALRDRSVATLRDASGATLRARAATDPKAVVRAAAQQFEALFMQQLMKSMRESSLASGMLENSGTQLGTEMLDTQFANRMTGLRGGLGDVIARQLERQMIGVVPMHPATAAAPAPHAAAAAGATADAAGAPPRAEAFGRANPTAQDFGRANPTAQEFVSAHQQSAQAAQAQTGIPAAFMVAQAAHESGWGRREIRNADGTSANNLFGIKAGAGWVGRVAEVVTTEVVDGQPRKVLAKFRAYASHDESFRDYARLMKSSPRYAQVLAEGATAEGFAQGLQRAGYATDPAYADKLTRVINTTLRLQRAVHSTA